MDWEPDEPYVPGDYNEGGSSSWRDESYIENVLALIDELFPRKDMFIRTLYDLIKGRGGVLGLGYMGLGLYERREIAEKVDSFFYQNKRFYYDPNDTLYDQRKRLNNPELLRTFKSNKSEYYIIREKIKDKVLVRNNLIKEIRNRRSDLTTIINRDRGLGFSIFGPMEFFSSDTRAYQDLLYAIEQSKSTPNNSTSSRTGVSLNR